MEGLKGFILLSLYWTSVHAAIFDAATHPKFRNALPMPDTIEEDSFTIRITEFSQDLGLLNTDGSKPAPTPCYGYEYSYPGPTIEVRAYSEVNIKWANEIPGPKHLLAESLDPTLGCSNNTINCATKSGNQVRTVVHLHGAHTPPSNDGFPESWFTYGFAEKGPEWIKEVKTYPNDMDAGALWYHDHAMGITRLNAYAGMAGLYIIRDDLEDQLVESQSIPDTDHEIPLVLKDKAFHPDGRQYYPHGTSAAGDPQIMKQIFGDYILTNGMIWPYVEVFPTAYRFRILNAADSRFFTLSVTDDSTGAIVAFHQIGTDSGFIGSPFQLTNIVLAPAERTDLVIDFSAYKPGQTLTMTNSAHAPFNGGLAPNPLSDGLILQFQVVAPESEDDVVDITLPSVLRVIEPLGAPQVIRKLGLWGGMGGGGPGGGAGKFLLGTQSLGPLLWTDPTTEKPIRNQIEEWQIFNHTPDTHPVHIHLNSHQVISVVGGGGGGGGFGTSLDNWNNFGWVDVTKVPAMGSVTLRIKFDTPGLYVWHCHILSHEDNEMMRRIEVQ